jgi:hypothetical protein
MPKFNLLSDRVKDVTWMSLSRAEVLKLKIWISFFIVMLKLKLRLI